MLKLALIQPKCELGCVENNLKEAKALCVSAATKGANFLCLPELFNTGYHLGYLGEKTIRLGLEKYNYTVDFMSTLAKELKCYILAPIVEPSSMAYEARNSALLFNDKGELIFSYAKAHLWALEAQYFLAGESLKPINTPFGKIGILICYDLGFPEAARSLCLQGAELIIAPCAWRIEDKDMWDLNTACRALENNLFLAGVNASLKSHGLELFGHSKLCDPRGHVVEQMGAENGYLLVELDLKEVATYREQIPYLKDRKAHLYELGYAHEQRN